MACAFIFLFNYKWFFDTDSTWPPDGAPSLQDNSGEQGEVQGVHFKPLVLVLVVCTPGSIIQVSIFNARLKNQTKLLSAAEPIKLTVASLQCEALHKILLTLLLNNCFQAVEQDGNNSTALFAELLSDTQVQIWGTST